MLHFAHIAGILVLFLILAAVVLLFGGQRTRSNDDDADETEHLCDQYTESVDTYSPKSISDTPRYY